MPKLQLPEVKYKNKKTPVYELKDQQKELHDYLDQRFEELKDARKNVGGINIDDLMKLADEDCRIRELVTDGKGMGGSNKILVENEELGLRGTSSYQKLGEKNWQSKLATNDPFVKIMIALAILFDNPPKARFEPGSRRFKSMVEVWKQLFENSWQSQQSREVLKAFIFDMAKYPYAVARTYIRQRKRLLNEIVNFNPLTGELKEQEKEVIENAEVIRERLNPKFVWIDDQAKANDMDSINDWLWEVDYSWDRLVAEFGDEPNFKYCSPDNIEAKPDDPDANDKNLKKRNVYRVQFYENYSRDRFVARVNVQGKPLALIHEPLPFDHKRLSLWTTFWFMRNPDTICGVSLVELIRGNKKLRNKIKNMSIDQLVLSIYKMFITDKRTNFKNQTKLAIEPGMIIEGGSGTWLEVPGPGDAVLKWIDFLDAEEAMDTGVQPTLAGEVLGKTAFEIGQAKEAALKRLKLPLENVTYALNIEGKLSTDCMYQAYTIPIVEHIVDQADIAVYLEEVQNDPKFYEWETDENGAGVFLAKRYKELALSVKYNQEKGMWESSGDDKFFHTMPDFVRWQGDIFVESTSLLSTWKELERANSRALGELVLKYLQVGPATGKKPLEQILENEDQNPRDWLPQQWLDFNPDETQQQLEQVAGVGGVTPEASMAIAEAGVPIQSPLTPQAPPLTIQ